MPPSTMIDDETIDRLAEEILAAFFDRRPVSDELALQYERIAGTLAPGTSQERNRDRLTDAMTIIAPDILVERVSDEPGFKLDVDALVNTRIAYDEGLAIDPIALDVHTAITSALLELPNLREAEVWNTAYADALDSEPAKERARAEADEAQKRVLERSKVHVAAILEEISAGQINELTPNELFAMLRILVSAERGGVDVAELKQQVQDALQPVLDTLQNQGASPRLTALLKRLIERGPDEAAMDFP